MKCQPCGHDNASSALFCTACRRPLVAPTKLPARLEPLAQPAMAMATPAMAGPYGGAADAGSSRNRFAPPNAGGASRMSGDSDILTEDEAWAAVIGDSNTHHYLTRFERLAHGDSGGWHWPAFFVTWYWMLYRKMWVPALLYFFAPWVGVIVIGVAAAAAPALAAVLYLVQWVAILFVPALMANRWYFTHCQNKIRDVRARGGSKDQMVARLEAAGGTGSIVVIILAVLGIVAGIGILAAVALPAYQSYTVKAKVAEAMPIGMEVAAAVGRQYDQTGQLPGQADVDSVVQHSTHRSKYVTGVDLDSASGRITVHVSVPPMEGTYQLDPSSDNNHHLSWTCSSTDKLVRYVPASCRPEGAPAR
ncbi:MAG: pilin [Vitreoscilla sp.]